MCETKYNCKRDLASKELEAVQQGIHTYGKVQFTIKGWAITIFSAFLAVSVKDGSYILLFPCVFALVLFWFLDSIYKRIQLAYISRAKTLEEFLNSEEVTSTHIRIPNTEKCVEKEIKSMPLTRTLLEPRIMLLYQAMLITIAAAAIIIYYASESGL
ncbi:MAG: hypothetical protein LJE91_02620 [Gammaproteobacteria bacterium]|jgi:hypothetical protein|nr:hypothetical protein [Gammaproteobacteria bacterium]